MKVSDKSPVNINIFGMIPIQIILFVLHFGNVIKLPLWLVWLPTIFIICLVSIVLIVLITIYIYDEWF